MIKVCVPFYQEYEFAKPSLDSMIRCKDYEFEIIMSKGYDPAQSRNRMVAVNGDYIWQKDFGGATHCLFHDSDMCGSAQHAINLVKHDKDIISGAYLRRDNPKVIQAGDWEEGYPGILGKAIGRDERGLKKVNYVGGGFLLVKTSVLAKLEYPWFRRYVVRKGELQTECGEDYGFCVLAQKAGFDVWVDCDTPIMHNLNEAVPVVKDNTDAMVVQQIKGLLALADKGRSA